MSQQLGMQMPGGRARRAASPDVYTGLLFVAVVAMALAAGVSFVQGGKIGPDGSAFGVHEDGRLSLQQPSQ